MRLNRKLTLLTEINEHKLFHIYPHFIFIFFLPKEITAKIFLPKNKKEEKLVSEYKCNKIYKDNNILLQYKK